MPLNCGMFGLADMPVANTKCFGLIVISLPPRSTTTFHSFFASSQFARLAVVPVQ